MVIQTTQILEEINQVLGFIPPYLQAAAGNADVLLSLWLQAKGGYLTNPLPRIFKDKFLLAMARWNQSSYTLVVRSCVLREQDVPADQIVQLLQEPMPSQRVICEQLRTQSVTLQFRADAGSLQANLEAWVLWAAVRIAMRKDRGGRCRKELRRVMGEDMFNNLILLGSFAAAQRIWIDSHPELDPEGDIRVERYQKVLIQEAPRLPELWAKVIRRSNGRMISHREQRLMAEIARQDRIRQALHESQRRFRRVVNIAPFPIMVYTEDGQVVILNKAWVEQSGWDASRIPTVEAWLALAQDGNSHWEPGDAAALEGWHDVVEEGEHQIHTLSGEVRCWDFYSASLGRLPDGRHAIMRVAVDVTQRQRLEQALWESNRWMVGILEAITDGFMALDKDGRCLYLNRKGESLLQVQREQVLGRTMSEVFPHLKNSVVVETGQRCRLTQTTEHLDWYSTRLDAYLEGHFYGSPEGMSIFLRDISQRKEMERQLRATERKFRSIFESNMIGLLLINLRTGDVLDCNDELLRIIGHTRADLEAGKINWRQLTPPEYKQLDDQAVETLRSGPCPPFEKEYMRKDGSRVPVMVGGVPLESDEEITLAFVADLTYQKQLEQKQNGMTVQQ